MSVVPLVATDIPTSDIGNKTQCCTSNPSSLPTDISEIRRQRVKKQDLERVSTLLLWQGSSLSQSSRDWQTGWPMMDRSLISHSACLACTLDQRQQPAWAWVISMMGPTFTWSNRYFLRYSGTRVKNDFYHKIVIYFFLIATGNQLCKHFTWLSLLQRKCPIVRNEPPPPSSWLFHMAVHALQQSTVCMPSRIPHGPPAANFGRCRYFKKNTHIKHI